MTAQAAPVQPRAFGQLQPRVYQGGGVIGFGNARSTNAPLGSALSSVMVGIATNPASTPENQGYWLAAADGGVFAQGNAGFYGSLGALRLQGPVVGIAADPRRDGATGSWPSTAGCSPSATPPSTGRWAPSGSTSPWSAWPPPRTGTATGWSRPTAASSPSATPPSTARWAAVHLVAPVTGMAATPDGRGYWMVAADGGIFTFGDAPFYGSMGGHVLNDPVVGMAPSPGGAGYLLVATDGGIFGFGRTSFFGSLGGGYGGNPTDVPPVAGIALTPDAQGYWLLEPDGWSYALHQPAEPVAHSHRLGHRLGRPTARSTAIRSRASFCNPYGPCEEWCALFATWVWAAGRRARSPRIPSPAASTTGPPPTPGCSRRRRPPSPGDAVLYGTGPGSTATSLHVGIVVQVWPDGAVVTVEGDAGPAPTGSLAVVINGPYLPSQSAVYNGMPVYAWADP